MTLEWEASKASLVITHMISSDLLLFLIWSFTTTADLKHEFCRTCVCQEMMTVSSLRRARIQLCGEDFTR